MSRIGIIGSSITLGARFYDNAQSFVPFSVNAVKIYTAPTNGTLLATLTPTEVATGFYQVTWDIPNSVFPSTLYDVWTWQSISSLPPRTQTFSFSVQVSGTITPEPPEEVAILGCYAYPSWVQYVGLHIADDVGNGMGLKLKWGEALPSVPTSNLYYNIYYSTSRFGVFAAGPKEIVAAGDVTDGYNSAIVNVTPGKSYYLAVRATEFPQTNLRIGDLEQTGTNIYNYPPIQVLNADLGLDDAIVAVESTTGYPSDGYLLVGFELMEYSSLDATNFYVSALDRGEFGTTDGYHYIGENVQLFWGFEEQNTNIVQATADWFYTFGPPYNATATGPDAYDGYRYGTDDLTTNLVESELSTEDFSAYDFNSYHRSSMQDLLNGSCVHSYSGGEFNGSRGLNLQDRLLSQLDMMLQATGENGIVLRRKWTGIRCRCISLRREHQRVRCPYCFNTGFEGGYDRLFNKRAINEATPNTEGLFMFRFSPYTDDLDLVQDQGLRQPNEETYWTLTLPNIKDRDVILKMTQDGLIEFAYVVLNVTRNKLLFNLTGRQDIKIRRLDKTDIIYTYPTSDSSKYVII